MRAALLMLSMTLAAPAAAAPKHAAAEARVIWTREAKPHVIVRGTVWRCEGETCRGRMVDKPFLKMPTCRAIARSVDRVTSFSSPSGAFGPEELARCNRDDDR